MSNLYTLRVEGGINFLAFDDSVAIYTTGRIIQALKETENSDLYFSPATSVRCRTNNGNLLAYPGREVVSFDGRGSSEEIWEELEKHIYPGTDQTMRLMLTECFAEALVSILWGSEQNKKEVEARDLWERMTFSCQNSPRLRLKHTARLWETIGKDSGSYAVWSVCRELALNVLDEMSKNQRAKTHGLNIAPGSIYVSLGVYINDQSAHNIKSLVYSVLSQIERLGYGELTVRNYLTVGKVNSEFQKLNSHVMAYYSIGHSTPFLERQLLFEPPLLEVKQRQSAHYHLLKILECLAEFDGQQELDNV